MKFNCPFCDEEFVNKNNFDNHMNNHNDNSYEEMTQLSSSEDSLWKYSVCKLCGEKFDNELDVKEHMDKEHAKRFHCQQCTVGQHEDISLNNYFALKVSPYIMFCRHKVTDDCTNLFLGKF